MRSPARVVAVVGLGRMGGAIAGRLLSAGFAVRGADPVGAARDLLTAAGGESFAEAAAAVAGSDIVILMLPDSDAVDAVMGDPDVVAALGGATVVDAGSSDPGRTRSLAERLDALGVAFVDAPVSGGVVGALAGELTIMVGGDDRVVDHVELALASFGRVVRVGPVGAGHAVKALNNLLSASHLLMTSEAVLAASRFGVRREVLLEVVNGSSGRSGSSELKWPRYILPGTFDSGFAMSLMVKDVRIALSLLDRSGVASDVADATLANWERALDALDPGADHTEIARWLEA